jgi:hypothetical protein
MSETLQVRRCPYRCQKCGFSCDKEEGHVGEHSCMCWTIQGVRIKK